MRRLIRRRVQEPRMWEQVARFSDWLATTPLSMTFQTVAWIIPAVQSVHIIAIAIVMSSVVMVDLRLLGLIIAEPRRDLLNPVFQVKMLLLIAAIAVTAIFQETVRRNMEFWDLSPG